MTDTERLKDCIFYLKKNKIIRNQQEIATETGYGYTTISEYLNEKTPISEKFINLFSKSFGFNPEWIISGEGKMRSGAIPVYEPPDPNPPPGITYDQHKEADLHRLEEIVEDMKRVNRELVSQASILIETNRENAKAILIHAEQSRKLVDTNDKNADTIKQHAETFRIHAELDIEREKTAQAKEDNIRLKEENLEKLTQLIKTMSRGNTLGEASREAV